MASCACPWFILSQYAGHVCTVCRPCLFLGYECCCAWAQRLHWNALLVGDRMLAVLAEMAILLPIELISSTT